MAKGYAERHARISHYLRLDWRRIGGGDSAYMIALLLKDNQVPCNEYANAQKHI